MTPTTSAREAKEVATFIEQMDMLQEDFAKYEAGHPDYPFVLIRDSVIAALNQYDRAYAALTREQREGGVKCDCGANADNRWPHHDECALNQPQQEAPGAVAWMSKTPTQLQLQSIQSQLGCEEKVARQFWNKLAFWANDTTPPAPVDVREELDRMTNSRDFYMRRCEALQAVQDKMRDPERRAVCDILANGSTTALLDGQQAGVDDAMIERGAAAIKAIRNEAVISDAACTAFAEAALQAALGGGGRE